MDFLRQWFDRHFSDPQAITLVVVLGVVFATIWIVGNTLAPVLASAVIAYLLDGLVTYTDRWRVPRAMSVLIVFSAFVTTLLFLTIYLLPLIWRQAAQLIGQLPVIFSALSNLLLTLPDNYPQWFPEGISKAQISEFNESLLGQLLPEGKSILESSIKSVIDVITLVVYLILMPLLVFFFMKDKAQIVRWLVSFLPPERRLTDQVWIEVNTQIGNYVRGKMIEILIVWLVTYLTFTLLGLQFSMLLSMVVGLSVLIPYIGATVVTLPVAIIGYAQWGLTSDFAWLMIFYAIIQALDGNVLVPLLFSEVVNLHPIAIIIAILIFSSIWGFWGLFFAIPLATLVQAVLKAWPTYNNNHESPPPAEALDGSGL